MSGVGTLAKGKQHGQWEIQIDDGAAFPAFYKNGKYLASTKRAAEKAAAVALLTPKCTIPTREGSPACWLKLDNHDNCYIWNSYVQNNDEMVTWSGKCRAGMPDGGGKVVWPRSFLPKSGVGTYANGKKHGEWEHWDDDGWFDTGSYVNGERHGEWKSFSSSGKLWRITQYKNGKQISSHEVD